MNCSDFWVVWVEDHYLGYESPTWLVGVPKAFASREAAELALTRVRAGHLKPGCCWIERHP